MLETRIGIKDKAVRLAHDIWEEYFNLVYPLTRPRHERRVFCIGREKTGTTTLSKCLHILGYRSFHWLHHGEEPPEGWIEYIRKRNFDALADHPICSDRFYRDLDRAFPHSRCILNVRDEDSWEKSYRNFVYGEKLSERNIDAVAQERQSFLEYNNDVIAYFKDRPDDFLAMKIFEGDGWQELCEFLGKEVPDVPFPHRQKGRYQGKRLLG